MDKIRVAVLYGGRSGEHEVSLISATNVIENLDRSKFEIIPIGIDQQGGWYLGDEVLKKELAGQRVLQLQQLDEKMLFNPNLLGKNIQELQMASIKKSTASVRPFDVVFPVIHGTLCEDGTIQGLLESADIPYVGCGVLASAIGMDKDVSKRLMQDANIPVAKYLVIKRGQWDRHPQQFCQDVIKQLPFPVFVKPANTGSSVGVHKVKSAEELSVAIVDAFRYDTKVIVEQGIDAIELEVAVLESDVYGNDPIVSVVGEIRPSHEFYSYAAKYLDQHGAESIIPAPVSPEIQEETRQLASKIFNVLECEGMARVDLFLERHTNRLYFNEVNTIPGFTQISMYPKLMEASGVSYKELLTHLVMLAIKRHDRKSKLSREYVSDEECFT